MIARSIRGVDPSQWSPVVIAPQASVPYAPEAAISPRTYGNSPVFATPGVAVPPIGNQTGQCPLVNGMPDPLVRECDAYTGVLHYQAALPSGIPYNANINTYNPQTNTFVHSDAAGIVQSTPVVPVYNSKINITAPPPNSPVAPVVPVTNTVQQSNATSITATQQGQNPNQQVVQPTPGNTPANTGSNSSFWDSLINLVKGPAITPSTDQIQYQTTAPYVNSFFSWLEQTVPIGNWDIPVWALGVVGIGGVYIAVKAKGGKKSRYE